MNPKILLALVTVEIMCVVKSNDEEHIMPRSENSVTLITFSPPNLYLKVTGLCFLEKLMTAHFLILMRLSDCAHFIRLSKSFCILIASFKNVTSENILRSLAWRSTLECWKAELCH